tara:strand:- start:21140 stop:21388 length:249 start_codon:yes stop_codon:yes gene_type:complete
MKELGDLPVLDVGSYPFEDLSKEELIVVERKFWKQGFDVQHELVDGGHWKHEGGSDWDRYIEPDIIEREKLIGRALKWEDDL